MLSLDANILFYAADRNAGLRHLAAQQILHDAAGPNAVLTEQSLFEFFHSSTRKGKIPVADAMTIVREFAKHFAVIHASQNTLERALALFSQYQLSIWDARILAICEAHGCDYLLSEDMQDGARYGNVTVVNPFKPANTEILEQALT
jgi:predicted nucleic acid-binding protein